MYPLIAAVLSLAAPAAVSLDIPPAAGWRVVYRKAVTSDAVAPAAAGPLVRVEMGAGGYAELAPSDRPTFDFTTGEVTVTVDPPEGDPASGQLGVRLVDANGEIFQARVRLIPASGGAMRFRFPQDFPESWGANVDKKLDPPLRLQTLIVAGPVVAFRLKGVSFAEAAPRGLGWYRLDVARGARIAYRSEVEASAAPGGSKVEVTVPRRGYAEWACDAFSRARFDQARRIRIRLNVDHPLDGALLSLRLLDADGECFQAAAVARLSAAGEQTVEVPVGTEAFRESWGERKNGEMDFPVRLASVVLASDKPGAFAATFQSAAVLKGMSASEGLGLSFDTGTRFHLVPPGQPARATLAATNRYEQALSGRLSVRFRDAWGRVGYESAHNLSLAPEETREIPLSLPALRPGAYTGEFGLALPDGRTEMIEAPARLAVMLPNGPAKRRDGFLFSVCTHTERFGEAGLVDEPEAAGLLGLRVARTFPGWRRMERKQGELDFSYADRFVANYARNGIELQPIVGDTPDWALWHPERPGGNQPPRPDAD